jgi:alpha-beta hydrolase superfamily lysophospholipase
VPVPPAEQPELARAMVAEDVAINVAVSDSVQASLHAHYQQLEGTPSVAVVMVPGGGSVGWRGVRTSDGVRIYDKPAPVMQQWMDALSLRGAAVLSYDKRSCGPNDDPACLRNDQTDLDKDGPVALSKDVDAACAWMRTKFGPQTPLVLWTHGQGGQVVLRSACAADAQAVVIHAPIPRVIDGVLVDALRARSEQAAADSKRAASDEDKERLRALAQQLKNQAASKEASFASMKNNKYAPGARVDGATIAFWLGWMRLTEDVGLFEAAKHHTLLVVGSEDHQFSSADAALQRSLPAVKVLVLEGADHHALTNEAVSVDSVDAVGRALDDMLATPRG